uniref:transposase domain-containing protein n=1 Tax=Reinekea sp. TaxID=1970455 RepID=UPI002A7F250E
RKPQPHPRRSCEPVGQTQSIISTGKLHEITPNTYLTDVLERINHHPMRLVIYKPVDLKMVVLTMVQ